MSEESRLLSRRERLNELFFDYRNCRACTLSEYRSVPIRGGSCPTAPVVVVVDRPPYNPSRTDGLRLGIIQVIFREATTNADDIWLSCVVMCPTGKGLGGEAAASPHRKACQQRLLREIDIVQPEVIVTLGAGPTQCLVRKDAKTKKEAIVDIEPAPGRICQALIPGAETVYRVPLIASYSIGQVESKGHHIAKHVKEAVLLAKSIRRRKCR